MLRGQRLFKPSLFSVRFSSTYKTIKTGQPFTAAHRVYFEKDGQLISPFHDIPLYSDPNKKDIVNMIVEIPRWNNAKVEISTGEKFNPLKQDVKKGKPRFVRNCFPYKGYIWNYGALPQTWEDPNHSHPETNARGDNDPIDVIEIGEQVATPGQVKEVKVLGIMALLDEGETDWKVFAIDVNDPLAPKLNDIEDVEKHLPGLIRATNEWFRIYKIPDGKPENVFAFNGEAKSKKYATEIVRETYEAWKALISGNTDKKGIEVVNTTIEDSPYKITPEPASSVKEETFDNIKEENVKEYDSKWYYV